jgi:hypothetical protein
MRLALSFALLFALPTPGLAVTPAPDAQSCRAILADGPVALGPDGALSAEPVDALSACAPLTVLRHLTPELQEGEREAFCLVRFQDVPEIVTGFSEGTRGDDLTCTDAKGFCEYVQTTKDAALDIAGFGEDASLNEKADAASSGLRTLRDGTAGATILSGTSAAVSGTLSSLGATALAAVTAPVAIAVGVVSVVAVGGAVYVCR